MTIEVPADVLSQRVAALYDDDAEFRAAEPLPAVLAAARRPGLRLVQVLQTLMAGYADRPTLGMRAGEAAADPATGRVVASVTGLRDHQLWRALVGGEGGRRGLE